VSGDRDELLDAVTRIDVCAAPGCRRLTRNILCDQHRRELATLGRDDEPEPEPPRAA
jgi:hypothetical protein